MLTRKFGCDLFVSKNNIIYNGGSMNTNLAINARLLVKDFGGLTAATRGLNEMGHTITKNAVDKWRRRDSLPTESILAFAVLAKHKNQRFDLLDYVVKKEM
jgi:hypothetical protein